MVSKESDLVNGPKFMRYNCDDKEEHFYQNPFCIIYEDMYMLVVEAPEGYVSWKDTHVFVAHSPSPVKAYIKVCVFRLFESVKKTITQNCLTFDFNFEDLTASSDLFDPDFPPSFVSCLILCSRYFFPY